MYTWNCELTWMEYVVDYDPHTETTEDYRVPAWLARAQQGLVILVAIVIILLGIAQLLGPFLTIGAPPAISVGLGCLMVLVGALTCWRFFQRQTFKSLRTGRFTLLDWF